MDEFIVKSIGGRGHQSRRVHLSYSPGPLGDKYILTCMHKDGRTYAYLKIKINAWQKHTKSDGCKMLNKRHK